MRILMTLVLVFSLSFVVQAQKKIKAIKLSPTEKNQKNNSENAILKPSTKVLNIENKAKMAQLKANQAQRKSFSTDKKAVVARRVTKVFKKD